MPLRLRQTEALAASLERWNHGVSKQLIQLPTGLGKTVVAASMAEHHGITGRILFLLHREELAEQTIRAFRKWNPSYTVGLEMGSSRSDINDRVVVASVPTIGREGSRRIENICGTADVPFELCITDEAHHSVATTYKNVFRRLGLLTEPGTNGQRRLENGARPDGRRFPLLVGITATPQRGDGKAMAEVYDEVVFQYPMRRAIEEGWLAELRGFKVKTSTTLDAVRMTAGDFNSSDLTLAVNTRQRNALVVRAWVDHAYPRQTIGFSVDVQHAKDLAAEFQRNSIPAEAIWADDERRADKLARHKRGELKVLFNCGILTEGYDDWRVQCIIMARPTSSQLLFVQMIGRGTRIPEGVDNLIDARRAGQKLAKSDCVVLDVVDCTRRNSLVTLSSIFGMNVEMDLQGQSAVKAVAKIEQMAEKNPNVDFSKVININDLDSVVEHVDLFEYKVPNEIRSFSLLSWHTALDGSYTVNLLNNEKISITTDLLGKMTVRGTVQGVRFVEHGFDDLQQAVQFAEMKISTHGKAYIDAMKQQAAKWDSFVHRKRGGTTEEAVKNVYGADHDEPAASPAIAFLVRAFGNKPLPPNLTKGQAKHLISQYISGTMRS